MANRIKSEKMSFIAKGKMDITFFFWLMLILTAGLVMLFSSSYAYALTYYNDSYYFIKKQLGYAAVGIVLMLLISKVNYHFWRKFAWPLYFVSIGMLAILYVIPPMVDGYRRWLAIGPINFQPSEVAKFSIILLFSALISNNYAKISRGQGIVKLLALLGLVCVLVLFETHLSATILIFSLGIYLIIVGGIKVKKKTLITGLVAGGGLLAAGLYVFVGVFGYARNRFEYWFHPEKAATGEGFQTLQSLYAIGSGGFLGRGLGQSRQKYLWVPEPHNDFIFAIVCEELGYVGAVLIIVVFCLLVWRGFTIGLKAPDKFGALLASSLSFQVGLQAALNILVASNTIPNTGISLPFFSYGGSSLIILLCEMGIILSVSRSSYLEKV